MDRSFLILAAVYIIGVVGGSIFASPSESTLNRSREEYINKACIDYGKYATNQYLLTCIKK